MIRQVVAVKDSAAETFGQPFFVSAVGAAVRSFQDEVNRSAADNPVYQHPEHFSLWRLGTFDDVSGEFVSDVKFLALAGDLIHSDKE